MRRWIGGEKRSLAELVEAGPSYIAVLIGGAASIGIIHIYINLFCSFFPIPSLLQLLGMLLTRRLDRGLLSALRSASSRPIPALRRLGLCAARPLPGRTNSTSSKRLDSSIMSEYADGVGAWGAWQVEPSKFTQLVVNSMRTLYVVLVHIK